MITLDEVGVVVTLLEVWHINDATQIADVGGQTCNLIFIEHTTHTLDGIFTTGCPHDEFANHRIIVYRNFVAFIDIRINTSADTMWFGKLLDHSRRRHEIVLRILSTDTTFDGMSTLSDVLLAVVQFLSVSDEDLLLHQVDAHDFLSDGMFHLQTGVHLQEIELMVLIHEELDGSCTFIPYGTGGCHGFGTHLHTQVIIDKGTWTFFHNFLMTTLHRAFTVKQMHYIAMLVTQNLELDVVGFFHKFLNINGIVTKTRHGFAPSSVVHLHHILFTFDKAHTFATTTH